ncbi:MAG TPA: urea transporter [Ramlibacter sp.]|nr:urea transporter [Ramlibacter sp.]
MRALLFGVSQSVFQQNGYTGLIVLCGVFLGSPPVGLAALLGLIASTLAAWGIGAERALILSGVYGFNGFFAGLALSSFFSPNPALWIIVALTGALTTAVHWFAGPTRLPLLSAPFVCALWLILPPLMLLAGVFAPAQIPAPGLGARLLADSARTWTEQFASGPSSAGMVLLNGTLRGIGQIFFQDDPLAGLIVLFGLLLNSSRAALLAAAGALTGSLTALLVGMADSAVFHGYYGFNSALSALAVATLIGKPGWRTPAAALLCAVVAAIATAAMIPLLRPAGLPALSAPFCAASWVFLLAMQERRPSLQ